MATGAEIPAPICETIRDQVGNMIIEQATTILINKLPQEEKNQADAPSEPPSVEGDNFLTPPSIDEVHCDVNNISLDASKVIEMPDQTEKDEPGKEEISSERIQQNAEEMKFTEKTEESSLIQAREQVDKESEKLQLTEESNESAAVIDKIKDEDEDIRKAELLENEENKEKEDNKTSCPEEKSTNANLQGVVNDNTEEKAIDAVGTQKEVLEDFPTIVSHEEIEEKPMIKVDDTEIKTAEHLEKENEKISPRDLEKETSFDQSMVMHERQEEEELEGELCEDEENRESVLLNVDSKMEEPNDTLLEASKETSYLLPDEKADEKTFDAAEIKEETSENVASIVSNEIAEDDSLIQVDCPEMKGHLDEVKTEDENPGQAELFENEINVGTALLDEEVQREKPVESCNAALEEINASENPNRILGVEIEEKKIDEAESIEEPEEQQDTPEDNKVSYSIEDIETTCSLEEPSLTTDSQIIVSTKTIDVTDTKEVTHEVQNDETTIPYEHTEETSVIQVDCTQMEHEEYLEKESENPPLEEQPEKNNGNESENMHEVKDRDAGLIKAELLENEENTGSASVKEEPKEEKPIESLQEVIDEIDAYKSSQCREIIEEQIQTSDPQEISTEIIDEKTIDAANTMEETLKDTATNPQGVLGDKTEEKTFDSAESKEITDELQDTTEDNKGSASNEDIETTCSLEEQSLTTDSQAPVSTETNVAIDTKEVTDEVQQNVEKVTPHEHIEENSVIQEDCTQMEHLEKESENPPLFEAQPDKDNDNESENMHEVKDREADLIKAELLETEENTGTCVLVKEETQVEKPIDSVQEVAEDTKASDSNQYTEIIEEQIQTAETQEISRDIIEEKTIDAADLKEGTLEDTATNPHGVLGDKTEEKTFDSDESKETTDELQDNPEDNKGSASNEDIETTCSLEEQSLTTDFQAPVSTETNVAIDTKEVTDGVQQNVEKITPQEHIEENSIIQEDCTQMEHLEKESENPPLFEAQPDKDNDNESENMHEVKDREAGLIKAELLETEENTGTCDLVKEEAQVEKPIDSVQVVAEDTKANDSNEYTETIEEQIQTAEPQEISREIIEEKTIDAADLKEETLEVIATNIPNGDQQNNPIIAVDGTENPALEKSSTGSAIDDESTVSHAAELVDESLIKAALFENEKNAEGILVQEEASIESLPVASEDIKKFASVQDRETTSLEEQSQTAIPQEIVGGLKEDKTNDGVKEETHDDEDVSTTIPCVDTEESSLILEDCSEGKHSEQLDKESGNLPLTETSIEENQESTLMMEETHADIKHAENLDCEEEQITTTEPEKNSSENQDERNIDAANMNEATLENTATTNPHKDTEDASIQDDCSQIEQKEHLEKESENQSLPSNIQEKIQTEDPQEIPSDKTEEKPIDATHMKDEIVDLQKEIAPNVPNEGDEDNSPIEVDCSENPSLEKASKGSNDDDAPTITYDTSNQDDCSQIEQNKHLEKESENQSLPSNIQEQIQTEDPHEIPSDKTEEKPIDATHMKDEIVDLQKEIALNVPNEGDEDNSPIEVDCTENPSWEKASKGSNDDDAPTITYEAKSVDESSIIADFNENEKTTEGKLVEEVPIEPLQEVTEEVVSVQDTERSFPDEQNPIVNPQEIEHSHEESKRNEAIDVTEEIPEDKNIAPTMPQEDVKDNSQIQVDCSTQVEKLSDALQVTTQDIKASGSSQDTETRFTEEQVLTADPQEIEGEKTEEKAIDAADTIEPTLENVETTIPHEATEVDCSEIEQNEYLEKEIETPSSVNTTESTLVKEEAQVGKLNDQLQVASEDIKACSEAEPETSSIEEQIRTVNPHEISSDELEVKPNNAADTKDEIVDEQDIATNVSNGDNENNLQTKGNGTEKLSLESTGSVDDDVSTITHDATCTDQSSTEADLIESGKNTEGTLAKDEVPIDLLQEVAEDIETLASVQERETSSPYEQSLTANPQQVVDDHKEIKTNEPDDKNVAPTMPQEDAQEKSQIQVDYPQMEYEEHLDIEEVTIDAASTDKETLDKQQDISANVPNRDNEDNSPVELKGSTNEDVSTISNEAKSADESSMKADSFEVENNTESTILVKEVPVVPLQEIAEDIKSLAPAQERETSSPEKQSPTVDPQEVVDDHKEIKTIDGAGLEEESLEDKNDATNTPQENAKENSKIEVDCSQMEYQRHLEKENDDTSSTETQTGYTIESTLAAKEEQMEKLIDCLQVNTDDAKPFASVQGKETSSTEEQVLTTDSRDNSNEETEERATDAAATSKEILEVQDNAPTGDNDDTSPTKADGTENPSLEKASTGNDNDDESMITHEVKFVDESSIIANLCETEKDTEAVFVKEEASNESPQVAAANIEDIKVSASIQDTTKSNIEEEIITEDEQEFSGNKTEEKALDSVDTVETLVVQNIAKDIPNRDDEDNLSIKETGPPKPFPDAEKVIYDGSITISTNENLVETDPKASTEVDVQVPNSEKEAQTMQQETDVRTNEKKIEEELPIDVSQDVSEPNGVNGEEEETRSSENFKEISDNFNFVALDDVSSCNLASGEVSTSITSRESTTQTQQKTENEEAQKQYEELHVVGLGDSSLENVENDVQVCLASAHDSDISPEMQKPEEASVPSSDEKITDNVIGEDNTKNEVVMQKPDETSLPSSDEKITENIIGERENEVLVDVDATKSKYIEQLEQDDTTKCFVDDQKPAEINEDETECKQEKEMLDEKVEKINETTSTSVSNDILPMSSNETSEIDVFTTERELTVDREEFRSGEITTGEEEEEEPKVDEDKTEGDEATKKQISDIIPETPDMIEKTEQDVARLPSESQEEICIDKITEEGDISNKTTDTRESTSLEEIHINRRSSGDLETKIDDEAQETIETTMYVVEGQDILIKNMEETSALTPQCETDKYTHAPTSSVIVEKSNSDEVESTQGENINESESKNQVLESIAEVQSCDIISKAEEVKTDEDNLEVAEGKPETDDRFESKEIEYEKENAEVDISKEKIKEDQEETIEGYQLVSCKEEVITKSHQEDEVKQEEEMQTEEIFEVIKNANESNKVSEDLEETNDKAVAEAEEKESEEQDQKDEICSSGQVQVKDEETLMLAPGENEEEACKANSLPKPTEAGDTNIYAEADKLEFSSHAKGMPEGSDGDGAQDIPNSEDYKTKKEHSEKNPDKSTECIEPQMSTLGKNIELIEEASKATEVTVEINESKIGSGSCAISNATEVDGQQVEEEYAEGTLLEAEDQLIKHVNYEEEEKMDDECNDLIGKSCTEATEIVSESNIHHSPIEDTTQGDEKQETQKKIDTLPILPNIKCSDIETAEKELPVNFTGLHGSDVTELEVTPQPEKEKDVILEADCSENGIPQNSLGNVNNSHGVSMECSQGKGEGEILKASKPEHGEADCQHEERSSEETPKSMEECESKDKPSLLDLLQVHVKQTSQIGHDSAIEKETNTHKEELRAEKNDEVGHEEAKTDEEKEDEEHTSEERKSDLCSEAPVMVEAGETDGKVAHKKSHNLLSGVGSKVKHSIAKVKKAITGKSSHPKPTSPK